MRIIRYSIAILCVVAFVSAIETQAQDFNIRDFGAVSDDVTVNTLAIQRAIDAAHKKKGRVIIPSGTYYTGTVQLKSNVAFFLEKDAVLRGSINPYDYKSIQSCYALIVAHNESNIKILGPGIIDGQGLKVALAIDSLHHTGQKVDPAYNYKRMRPETRPMIIDFKRCQNIVVKGITLKDSPFWVQNYTSCNNIVIDSITVNSVAYWNNDGIDITGSSNVRITDCMINSADDGICLKTELPDHINDSIYIANCIVRSSASAIKFGTASHGKFANVVIENIKVYDTYRSAIALECVDGGHLENIQVNKVEAVNTGNAILIRLGHRNKNGEPGVLRNVSIQNVKVQIPFERPDMQYDLRGPDLPFFHNPFPASITGLSGHYVENVSLSNIDITYPGRATKGMAYVPLSRLAQVPECKDCYPEFSMFGELPAWAFYVRHVKGLSMTNVKLSLQDQDFRPAIVLDDVVQSKLGEVGVAGSSLPYVVSYQCKELDFGKDMYGKIYDQKK